MRISVSAMAAAVKKAQAQEQKNDVDMYIKSHEGMHIVGFQL